MMNSTLLSRTVGELVTERPSRSRVFERFGIDYCCGGKRPLAEACEQTQAQPEDVLAALRESDETVSGDDRDWSRASMSEIVEHIIGTHHAYLERELPRLADLADKVVAAHGERHPEVMECRGVLTALKAELEAHMQKEEQVLFPMIRELEGATVRPHFHCGSIRNPITVMEKEHDGAAHALRQLRDLTRGYTPPGDACNTYRAWLDGLAGLEADLHQHVHKENNILFPKALRHEQDMHPA